MQAPEFNKALIKYLNGDPIGTVNTAFISSGFLFEVGR